MSEHTFIFELGFESEQNDLISRLEGDIGEMSFQNSFDHICLLYSQTLNHISTDTYNDGNRYALKVSIPERVQSLQNHGTAEKFLPKIIHKALSYFLNFHNLQNEKIHPLWVLCMYENEIVSDEFMEVRASNKSKIHSLGTEIELNHANEYESKIELEGNA